ncbi:hypothetical protein [Microvirgula aerodenitrificans]|uniref:hypothetical protein n=1 Tax=Microvirgula aerodenitrificans TaxID=57480 RepID=UPI00248DD916|nr:hypothetical protein [Microvirgula aerodenitrificans]
MMTLERLRTAFHMGGLTAARVVANGSRFHAVADTANGDQIVLARHSDATARAFSDPGTVLRMLRDIGFRVVTVDMTNWHPEQNCL